MIFFFISLSAEWWRKGDLVSWVSIGTVMFAMFVLVGWCIWTARDRTKYWWFQVDLSQASLINDQPEDNHRTVWPRLHLIKRITHLVSAVRHSVRRNGSVQDVEMPNRSSVIINIRQPRLPSGDVPLAEHQEKKHLAT